MNASEARRETNRVIAENSLGDVFSSILKAARTGVTTLTLPGSDLNQVQAEVLKAKHGYRVTPDRGESGPVDNHRPIQSWVISW